MRSAPASIIRSPERTSASSSTSRTRTFVAHAGQGRVARRTKSPAASGPCSSSPPASSTRSASPTRPVPAPGSASAAGAATPTARPADDLDDERGCPPRPRSSTSTAARRRVLARVGQALLDDAIGRAPEGGGQRRVGGHVDRAAHAHPRCAGTRRRAPGRRPAWAAAARARSAGGPSRSTPMTSRSSSSAAWALARMTPAASATSSAEASGWNSSAPACRLSSETRWARTSCISRAMRRRSASRACSTRRRCSASSVGRALAQREHELALDADEQAPADHDAGDQHAEDDLDAVGLVARVEQREDRGGGQRERRPSPRIARREARMATLKRAISAGPPAAPDTSEHTPAMRPTASGCERRNHRATKATAPRARSTAIASSLWSDHVAAEDERAEAGGDRVHREVDDPVARRAPAVGAAAQLARQQHALPARQRACSWAAAVMVPTAYARGGAPTPDQSRRDHRPPAVVAAARDADPPGHDRLRSAHQALRRAQRHRGRLLPLRARHRHRLPGSQRRRQDDDAARPLRPLRARRRPGDRARRLLPRPAQPGPARGRPARRLRAAPRPPRARGARRLRADHRRARAARRRPARARRARPLGGAQARAPVLAGHAPAAGPRARAARRPGGPDPRRAGQRPGPRGHALDARAAARLRRPRRHGTALLAPARGGPGGRRPDRDHRRGAHRRPGRRDELLADAGTLVSRDRPARARRRAPRPPASARARPPTARFVVDAEPEAVGRAALAGGVALTHLGPGGGRRARAALLRPDRGAPDRLPAGSDLLEMAR